ncbi:MAG: hypothetical protein PQJ58_17700 [Spirochaetales bacterium]|nr:hypothetical protein [Spirochaetales bacterium]
MKKQEDYISFINSCREEGLLLLELGVGFNTPSIIRFPFEKLAAGDWNIELVRVNRDDTRLLIPEAEDSFYPVQGSVDDFLNQVQQG